MCVCVPSNALMFQIKFRQLSDNFISILNPPECSFFTYLCIHSTFSIVHNYLKLFIYVNCYALISELNRKLGHFISKQFIERTYHIDF